MRGYKLFEKNVQTGEIFPLFIGKKTPTPVGEWVPGEILPTKGYAERPGWHAGVLPVAPWLLGEDGSYKSSRGKRFQRVWYEVEINSCHDYTEEVQSLPGKCFKDRLPENGFYLFREAGKGTWYISSDLRVLRELSWEEVDAILAENGYDFDAAFAPYKAGFEKKRQTREARKNQ